jgi:hypothetical protein
LACCFTRFTRQGWRVARFRWRGAVRHPHPRGRGGSRPRARCAAGRPDPSAGAGANLGLSIGDLPGGGTLAAWWLFLSRWHKAKHGRLPLRVSGIMAASAFGYLSLGSALIGDVQWRPAIMTPSAASYSLPGGLAPRQRPPLGRPGRPPGGGGCSSGGVSGSHQEAGR